MFNNQIQPPQSPNMIYPFTNQNQPLSIENNNLKEQVKSLQLQLKNANQKCQELQSQNNDLKNQVASLQSQLSAQNQFSNNPKNTIQDQTLNERCIQLQRQNQDLQKKLEQQNILKDDNMKIQINCIPFVSQSIKQERVQLSWIENIVNLQITYQRKDKIVQFQGYGEVQNQGFIFNCQCVLQKIPPAQSKPQIIQKERELFLIFEI